MIMSKINSILYVRPSGVCPMSGSVDQFMNSVFDRSSRQNMEHDFPLTAWKRFLGSPLNVRNKCLKSDRSVRHTLYRA